MAKLKHHDRVRFVRGQTVDTDHVEGGDLRGLKAKVISQPFVSNGKDGGKKGELRVAVGVDDDAAPRGAGILTAPVANLELDRRSSSGTGRAGSRSRLGGHRKTYRYSGGRARRVR